MKILITGVGITGKSSFRRMLVSKLRKANIRKVMQYDADEFKELRHPQDADCEAPKNFQQNILYIIEDIHSPTEKAFLSLREYDLILYLIPDRASHFMFWLSRCWRWFQFGQFSWEKDIGWKGTGKPYDYRNIFPIIKILTRDFKNREAWITSDLKAINRLPHLIVHPYWTPRGIRFSLF